MPQLSLYMDDKSMDTLREQAGRENKSLSCHVRSVLQSANSDTWPKGYWSLYGALDDGTFITPAELAFSDDIPRPCLD